MKKQYFWIYVLPVLMLLAMTAFGILGLQSAVGEQRMQQELAKVDWKMEPVVAVGETRPFYQSKTDTVKLYCQNETGNNDVRWFTADGKVQTAEELDTIEKVNLYMDEQKEKGELFCTDGISMREAFGEDLLIWTDFSEGLALLYYKDRLVCVDKNREIVFEKKAHIPERYIEGGTSETTETITGLNRDGFRDGLAVFTLDGCKYGVLDEKGNIIIEPVFKGKYSLMVLTDQHMGVFYEREFRIGSLHDAAGGESHD